MIYMYAHTLLLRRIVTLLRMLRSARLMVCLDVQSAQTNGVSYARTQVHCQQHYHAAQGPHRYKVDGHMNDIVLGTAGARMTVTVDEIVGLGNASGENDVPELEHLSGQASDYHGEVGAEEPPEEGHDGKAFVVGLLVGLVVPVPPEEEQPVKAQHDVEYPSQNGEEPSGNKVWTF